MSGPVRGAAGTVVFVHAHPDDEAIFTGGTIALLAGRWVASGAGDDHAWRARTSRTGRSRPPRARRSPGRRDPSGGRAARRSPRGVPRVRGLGDGGRPRQPLPGAFAAAPVHEAAGHLANFVADEQAAVFVTYDAAGIYGHPDHVKAHDVTLLAAAATGVETVYEATVDREYLHFVETHLAVEAGDGRSGELGLAATSLGLPTVLVTCTIDIRPVLPAKRAAMEAHASQIPETSSAMRMPAADFAAVYGYEWFGRQGPPGPVDELPQL